MHELSIAMSLVELACDEAPRHPGRRVTALYLSVGVLSGVDADALAFSFAIAAADTAVARATLVIESVGITAHCPRCLKPQTIASPQRMQCPSCGTPTTEILRGRELQLTALELDDAVESAPAGESIETSTSGRHAAAHR